MRSLFLIAFLLVGQLALAHKFTIKEKVLDDQGSPLPSTTVLLLQPKDSTLVSFASTDTQGAFELKNLTKNTYLLKISFVGFSSSYKTIDAPDGQAAVELGTIQLKAQIM